MVRYFNSKRLLPEPSSRTKHQFLLQESLFLRFNRQKVSESMIDVQTQRKVIWHWVNSASNGSWVMIQTWRRSRSRAGEAARHWAEDAKVRGKSGRSWNRSWRVGKKAKTTWQRRCLKQGEMAAQRWEFALQVNATWGCGLSDLLAYFNFAKLNSQKWKFALQLSSS